MKKRFVSIWFPHLATELFQLQKPSLANTLFVLTVTVKGKKTIAAVCKQLQGEILPGMTLADARIIIPDLLDIEYSLQKVERLLKKMAAFCIRFTPVVCVDGEDGILLDSTGCSHLWRGDDNYLSNIKNRFCEKGFTCKLAIADTIGAAWGYARHGKSISIIPAGKTEEAVKSLPLHALRLDVLPLQRLNVLGLNSVKDLMQMPASALRRRFGPIVLKRINQALGFEEEFIQGVESPPEFCEHLPLPTPILTRSGVDAALDCMANSLAKQLQKQGKGLGTAILHSYKTDSTVQTLQITTRLPSSDASHILKLFALKIETLKPEPGIELFILEARQVAVLKPQQDVLWQQSGGLYHPDVSMLLDKISARLGEQAISRYLPDEHWWPERSFRKAKSISEHSSSPWQALKPRPIQLLDHPQKIEVTAPIPDYPPMNFRYKGKLHKVIAADGPERIEPEWWISEGEHRDYYTVEDENGCRFWIFRLGHYNEHFKVHWFLHGFFG